jgi:hypothetical protein
MKYCVVIMLVGSMLLADPEPYEKLPECPPPIVIQEKKVIPDWVWFIAGAFTATGTLSFFYYNRK